MNTKNIVTVKTNGPLILEGNFRIKGVDGNITVSDDKIYLCSCGKSNKKPFCDGEHKK